MSPSQTSSARAQNLADLAHPDTPVSPILRTPKRTHPTHPPATRERINPQHASQLPTPTPVRLHNAAPDHMDAEPAHVQRPDSPAPLLRPHSPVPIRPDSPLPMAAGGQGAYVDGDLGEGVGAPGFRAVATPDEDRFIVSCL